MIPLAISTRWNAGRHRSGEAMIEEILDLGLGLVELGYDLRAELIPGVKTLVASGAVRVGSLHNFCPVPVGAPRPHPELYTPASPDRREREFAVIHISRTLRFAAEMGATMEEVSVLAQDGVFEVRNIKDWAYSPAWYPAIRTKANAAAAVAAPEE